MMTIQSKTSIESDDGARIVKRLCNHWKHKFEITEQDGNFFIPFPEANVNLEATNQQILIEINTEQTDKLEHYQNVVINHLNRMAQQEFSVEWQISQI